MTTLQVVQLAAAVAGLAAIIYGAGRAWQRVTGDLGEIKVAQEKHGGKLDAVHRRMDAFQREMRSEVASLRVTDAELAGRVDMVERLAGLPPPWKRTQPIRVPAETPGDTGEEQ